MTQSKNTKRALLASVLSVVLCAAMLVGTTFAWFTDSVTSGKNIIQAGNLGVKLEYSTDLQNWEDVDAATNVFKEGALWEPGYTEVVYLRVSNAGSLALKYKFAVNAADKVIGQTADGKDIDLSNFIKFGVAEAPSTAYTKDAAGRAAAVAAVDADATLISAGYSQEGVMEKDAAPKVLAMVVYMPEEVGNEANYRGDAVPSINLGINLVATQAAVESDSFDNQYDAGAFYPTDEDAADAGMDAKVNGKYYKDLASAVAAAEPQATIALIDDTTVASSVKLDAEDILTIDLNGKKLEAPNGTAINMSAGGELTLVNGTVTSKTYAVYAAEDAVIHELNINMDTGYWGIYLSGNAVLEKVTGGTYTSSVKFTYGQNAACFPLYVSTNATIKEISGGDFQGSKAAIANYGNIEKISGGTFHGTYYDGSNATMWEPDYSVMYMGKIGSITGGTFFKGKTNIAQNMTSFDAALTAGGTQLVELPETATIVYKMNGTIEEEFTGHYYKVQ